MLRSLRSLAVLALGLACMVPAAHAGLVLDLQSGGAPTACGGGCGTATTIGWEFNVSSTTTVDALGIWDAFGSTFPSSSEVGLWTAGGSLLASATITPASIAVSSANTAGDWLFANVTSVNLTPGDYLIGNTFGNSAPLAQIGASYSTMPQITLLGGVVSPSDSFAAPTDPFFTPIFGPTFSTTPVAAAVPEPATWGLMLLGIGGMAAALRLTRGRNGTAQTV